MATHHEDDPEVFRRRVQEKLAEKYDPSKPGTPELEQKDGTKKSPYCVQNFLWLGMAIAVFYFSNFIPVMLYDLRIRGPWFCVGLLSMGFHVSIAAFLVFYLSYWKKMTPDEWEKAYPKAVPVATASFILGLLCLSVALWPVWGLLTPVILVILFMGVVVVIAMVG